MNLDFIEFDELDTATPKRELIAAGPTGRTVLIRFPADWDLGEVLPDGYVIGIEAPPD